MHMEKISKTVTSALAYLAESVDAHTKGDEEKVMQLTWHAASDLEYGLFLLSLINPEETRNSSWKLPPTKQPNMDFMLASTRNLLEEATESLEADDLKEVYKKTWMARGQLFRIHDFFEKKQRKAYVLRR